MQIRWWIVFFFGFFLFLLCSAATGRRRNTSWRTYWLVSGSSRIRGGGRGERPASVAFRELLPNPNIVRFHSNSAATGRHRRTCGAVIAVRLNIPNGGCVEHSIEQHPHVSGAARKRLRPVWAYGCTSFLFFFFLSKKKQKSVDETIITV